MCTPGFQGATGHFKNHVRITEPTFKPRSAAQPCCFLVSSPAVTTHVQPSKRGCLPRPSDRTLAFLPRSMRAACVTFCPNCTQDGCVSNAPHVSR